MGQLKDRITGVTRRLAGTIAFPNETFKEISRKPTWLAPIIIAVLAVMLGNAFYYWRVNPDWEQRARARIEEHRSTTGEVMTPEQVEKQVAFAKTLGRVFILLPLVAQPAFCLAVAAIYFVGFGMLFLTAPPFRKILAVVAWSEAANRVLAALALVIVLMIVDKEKLQDFDPARSSLVLTNLSTLLPADTSALVKSLASSLDIFIIWFLILLTIGFANIAEAKTQKIRVWRAAVLVFGLWGVWVLLKAALAVVFGY
jgi:hypothetical protein